MNRLKNKKLLGNIFFLHHHHENKNSTYTSRVKMKKNTSLLFYITFWLYYCEFVICLDNKQIYQNLRKNIASIKESCGQICDQTIKGTAKGKYFEFIQKNVVVTFSEILLVIFCESGWLTIT